MPVKRPAPDAGVAAAVESCQSNTKMKRMVMFGLRALSELCTPPRGRFKENSLDAIGRGITSSLVQISSNMNDDEEIMELVMKVCWGIAVGLEDYRDRDLIAQFEREGGASVVASAVNAVPSDGSTVMKTFTMLEALADVGIEVSAAELAPGLIKALENTQLSPEASVKVATAINTLAHRGAAAQALAEQGAALLLVNFSAAASSTSLDPLSTDAICNALVAAGCIAKAGGGDAACVMITKDLIEKNKGIKKIVEAGSEALAGMLTLDQLSAALEALQTAESESPDRDSALEILSAMSYVQAFAEVIVESGCVPLLVQAVNSTLDDLASGNRDETLMKGFVGTVTLLGRIAQNPFPAQKVYDAGGLSAIGTALASVTDHSDAYGASCLALSGLANAFEEYSTELYNSYGTSGVVLAALYENASDRRIHEESLEFLAALSQYVSLQEPLMEESAVEIISYSLQYNTDNLTAQTFGFLALSRLVPGVYTTSSIYEYGGFQGIAQSLLANITNESIVTLAVRVLGTLGTIPDAKNYSSDGVVVDAVLYAMLEHSQNGVVLGSGRDVLENLATDSDADRHVRTLDGALSNATSDNEAAFKALAAARGLSSVQRLSGTFEKANTANKILQHLKRTVENPGSLATVFTTSGGQRISIQEKLLRSGMSTVEVMALASSGSMDNIVPDAISVSGNEKMKLLLTTGSLTPEVMFESISKLAAADRIKSQSALQNALSNATTCLKRFSDYRNLSEQILEIIAHLANGLGSDGAKLLLEQGGVKVVLDHMRKMPFSVKCQIHGMRILGAVLQTNPDAAADLRKAGTVDVIQSALRTHQNDRELRASVAPILGQLIPTSELEDLASRNIAITREALDVSDYKRAVVAMRICNDIAGCPEGARALARVGAAKELSRIEHVEGLDQDKVDVYAHAAQMISLMAGQRIGADALISENITNTLLKLIKDLSEAGQADDVAYALSGLGRILQGDPGSAVACLHREIVQIITHILKDYPNHVSIVLGVSRVIGALARTEDQAATLVAQPEISSMIEQFNTQIIESPKRDQKVTSTHAINELVFFENPIMTGCVAATGVVPTLVDQLDTHKDDKELVKYTAEALSHIGAGTSKLRDYWESQRGDDIRPLAETFVNCIQAHMNDATTLAHLINGIAKFAGDSDGPLLKEAGLFDSIRHALAIHPDEDDIHNACAELLEAVGASDSIRTYMQQIIGAEAQGDVKSLNDALENLNVLLLAPISDPDYYLADEEDVWNALTRQLRTARDTNDIKTMRNIMIVAQRLVDQGKPNPDGYHGAWYCAQTLLPVCNDMLLEGGSPMQAKRLLTALINTLAGVAQNPNTYEMALDSIPISTVLDLLEVNQNEIDLAAAVTGLLFFLGQDNAGIEAIKGQKQDIVPLLSNIMRVHRGRVKVEVPAMGLTGNCAKPGIGMTSSAFTNGEAIKAAFRGTGTGAEAQGYLDANMMGIMEACVKNPDIRNVLKAEGAVVSCMRRLDGDEQTTSKPTSRMQGLDSAEPITIRNHYAFAKMLESYGLNGEAVYVHEKGGMKKLIDMLDEFVNSPKVYNATLEAIAALALADPLHCGQDMMENVVQRFLGPITADNTDLQNELTMEDDIGKLLLLDGELSDIPRLHRVFAVVRMLEALKEQPGWAEVKNTQKIQQILTTCEDVATAHEDEELLLRIAALKEGSLSEHEPMEPEGADMNITEPQVAYDVDPDDPNALTLKQVHDWLAERLENNQTIDVNDSSEPLLYERFQFVFTKMTDYIELMLTMKDFAGYQAQWGCKAWTLWATYTPAILNTLLEWEVHTLLFDYINNQALKVQSSRQKEVIIATPPSATLAAFGSVREPGATTLAALPNVAPDCTRNIHMCIDDPKTNNDENIIPRTEMVEKIAINRTIFTDPAIIEALLKAWDQYDTGIYTAFALRHIFRAMRRVVCDYHTDFIIEQNVTQRLIDELRKDFDNPLLIDGFFLLGVLAVDNRLKTIIGQQNGIQESLTILANHMDDPPGEGVITNSQLALANLVVGHRVNCNMFHKYGGLQLNVRVLNERGEHFDETNAAAALLTNACFRREDIKAAYGQDTIGAPSALSYAISCYDGGTDQSALRCLSNMFKAISNMSLYTPNVDLFLESGLENAYYNLLMQSAGLPDEVVKTGLFTLSNLTWENKEENMVRFGIIVPPLIEMASQGIREDPNLLGSTFETLTFLCRLPNNIQLFCEYGGTRLAVSLIQSRGKTSLHLLQQALGCLSSVSRATEYVQYLVDEDVLSLAKDVMEGQYFQEENTQQQQYEASLTSLRITRRIFLAGGGEVVGLYSQAGGPATLAWYLETLAATDDPLPQLALEALKTLIGGLSIGQGDDATNYVSIEDQIDNFDTSAVKKKGLFGKKKQPSGEQDYLPPLERPTTPRGYEVMGLDAATIRSLVNSTLLLCQQESLQRSSRFTRCSLGFLGYVAAEDIPGADTLICEYAEMIGKFLKSAYEELGGSIELPILAISILSNTAYHHTEDFVANFGKESSAFKTLTEMSGKMGAKERDKIEKERAKKVKDRLEEFMWGWKALLEGDTADQMRKFASYETDFSWTSWHKDPYPNGVHDLLIKEELRAGGRFKIVVDEKTRDSFFWRANQTLALFQWRVEKEKTIETEGKPIMEFTSGVPVSKISGVTKGLGNDILRRAAKKQRGLTADVCFVMQGPPTEDFPHGFDFGLKAKTKAERDQFIDWLLEWREACSL